ncbi:hypothetical protein K3495_g12883 [Podosphaera aphanis]|nr:hypothetical protein K3495_g12883 [Podosphaera aphanis]
MAISVKNVPVEAHWSLGTVELYHTLLRRSYSIIKKELKNTGTNKACMLQMEIKAINDSAGPNGLVPTLLVFGAYPRLTNSDPPALTITQRAAAIRKAMDEISKIRAKIQVNNALSHRNGPDTTLINGLAPDSDVLVYREGNYGQVGKWEGPFKLIEINNETCTINLPSGTKNFRSTVVRPFFSSNNNNIPVNDGSNEHHTPSSINKTAHEENQESQGVCGLRTNPIRTRRLPARFRDNPSLAVLFKGSASSSQPNFIDPRQKEINVLLEKGVFKKVNSTEIPPGTRIFRSRFVDEIKNPGTEKAIEKSRMVVQAYNDRGKDCVLTQSPIIQRVNQRIILALASMLPFDLYLRDITQAYVQSNTELNRNFYIWPPIELAEKGTILKVVKPLYGVPEAGNYWYKTYHQHHTKNLLMKTSTYDPCLLYSNNSEGDFGIVGLQTDETIFLANGSFATKEEVKLKQAKFLAKEREKLDINNPIRFNGGCKHREKNTKAITLTQERHCKNLKPISPTPVDITGSRGQVRHSVSQKEQFVAQRAREAYVASMCQPESSFDLSSAAQVTNPDSKSINKLNSRIEWQIKNASRGLKFVELDLESLQLIIFTDSSFANNNDLSSQIGFVMVLADKNNKANIIHWSSTKCKRITRSVLATELYGMANGFDIGASIKSTFDEILEDQIPLVLCTDSKSLYDCLVKLGTTQEKRLMIGLMCLRQSYERKEIAEVRWIEGSSNLADAMTKEKPCHALKKLIDSNSICVKQNEWVER